MGQPNRPPSSSDGAEDYPYDPAVRVDELRGLDRLRGVADRKLAAHLYLLYVHAERNSSTRVTPKPACVADYDALRRIGARALAGEFGVDARELAEYLLLDDTGQPRDDERSLRAFGVGFRKLRDGHY